MITLATLVLSVYALLEGVREALYFHYKWTALSKQKHDEHWLFSLQRAVLVIALSLSISYFYGWYCFVAIAPMALCFSFMHNGMYYSTRNNLQWSVYPSRWRAQSTTTTAKFSFGYKARLAMFVVGCVLAVLADVLIITFA